MAAIGTGTKVSFFKYFARSENMAMNMRSPNPCVSGLKSFLDIKDFKSPRLKLSPSVHPENRPSQNRLSPYGQCNSNLHSPSSSHFICTQDSLSPFARKKSNLLSVDSPRRLLFVSKIKTTLSTANLLGRGRFGQVVLAKYKGISSRVEHVFVEINRKLFTDSYVAVKIVNNVSKQQFINEMNGQGLVHRNIVKTLSIEQIDDDVMVLMEPWGSLNLQQLLSLSVHIPFEDVLR